MTSSELKLLHAGNENLFGILIASLEPALRGQIRKYVGADSDLGDDLFQEVCIKVFGRLKDYRADGPFGAWCYRVCARVCLDYLRRTARTRRAMP